MTRIPASRVARMAACIMLPVLLPAAAQTPAPAAAPTLIRVDNTNPALVTDRHLAAQAAGYRALHYCSGIFSAGLPENLLEESLSARASRDARTVIDREKKIVSVYYASDMEPRIAAWRPVLGCVQLPIGASMDLVAHLPRLPETVTVPSLDDRKWPMGDADATAKLSKAKTTAVAAVLDEAFRNDAGAYRGHTWGVVVVKDGRIVAERYEQGWGPHTAARTNSMCKSVGVSLVGIGVRKGLVDVHRKAPLKAWQTPGDPRGNITLNDMLHMASGLYTDAGGDPQRDIYDAGAPPSEVSMLNMVDSRPGARFLYAGSDTILSGRAVREALGDDAKWLEFPYREFLWKLGMTRTVVETDWRGDFLLSGQCWSTARDFGRFGLLYLADGVWNGERLLPEGWSKYVSTLAPAQPAGYFKGGPGYGAQFWVHNGREGLPDVAYAADGAGGQYAMIVPSANLVVVRRGLDVTSNFNIAKFSADVINALSK
ncbi:MAG TPA: serine hydrolase [Gammaproteobacteria bacterium]|nr:serine hydrolase [Gammaproteobacteria bacterium]